ncbi:MAG: OsmC family protein [Aquiluna sp.]|nr:OsmC family protein [Aquiluna sp.]MCF8545943.1 OsmC family protein [Aquiluna sp.]
MLRFQVQAHRVDEKGAELTTKEARLTLDTSIAGRVDALNPVELLLASQAACFIKGIERLALTLNFDYTGVEVSLEADRPEDQARISQLRYQIQIDTKESDQRLELLHKNLKKQGTIYNTISAGTELIGSVARSNR